MRFGPCPIPPWVTQILVLVEMYYVVLIIKVAPPLSGKNQMQVDSPPNPVYNKLFSNATTEIHFPVSKKEHKL